MPALIYSGEFRAVGDGGRYWYSLHVECDQAIAPAKFDWIKHHPVFGNQVEIADSLYKYFSPEVTRVKVGVDYDGESLTEERP